MLDELNALADQSDNAVAERSDNADVPIEPDTEPSDTPSRKDFVLLFLVTLIKLGESIEVYLPGVITQEASFPVLSLKKPPASLVCRTSKRVC